VKLNRFLWATCVACVAILSSTASLAGAQAVAAATKTGTIAGRVTDGVTGSPLPGAKVVVEGAASETSTDREGNFRLDAVPAGSRTLVVSYLGHRDQRIDVSVTAGTTKAVQVEMKDAQFSESVTVAAGLIRDAEERALNQQKTAPNITNVVSADQIGRFPDQNAAETTQRIPGISIQRDQGEGRYVIVRGTEPRLNSMLIDGERIPSPDPSVRQVALDVIPSDLLQSIEVSKALTPDMDGDAIGGSVNLVMKQAPEKFRLLAAAAGGYNRSLSSYDQDNFSVTTGRRFNGGKVGVIGSASATNNARGNQDFEPTYTSTQGLAGLDIRDYTVHRDRYGATGAVDFKTTPDAAFVIRGVYNRFTDDHELRRRLRENVSSSRIDRELRDRTHIEQIGSLAFSGQQVLGRAELDYKVNGAYSSQFDPLTVTTTFRQSKVTFAPNVTATSIDPDNIQANPQNENLASYTFNSQIRATNFAQDRDAVAQANLRLPLQASNDVATFVKFGVKYRDKRRSRDRNESTLTTAATLRLTDFLDTGFNPSSFLDGRYDVGDFIGQDAALNLPNAATMTSVRNHARDAEEYFAGERVSSAYAMAEIYAGSKLFILPGVRYEYTSSDYQGNTVLFSPSGAYFSTQPVTGDHNYGVPLPDVHVRYAITPETNLRLALTRSLARPNYYDLVPYRAQDDSASTLALGNPTLKPTKSWNLDFMAERYLKSVGLLSAGVFYKRLEDYIYVYTFGQTLGDTVYQTTQPLNGEAASIRGLELAMQNRFTKLPSPWDGFGLFANYTFTDSSAAFPGRTGEKASLPGQSRHVGNVSLSYEKGGFSGRVSINFHGSYIDQVGASSTLDRFYDTHKQLDASISRSLTPRLRLFLDALNLTNAPLRYYQGDTNHPLQEEHYRWWLNFGVKASF
jgi:TonB-dependent receptor